MKKLIFLVFTIATITIFSTSVLGAENLGHSAPTNQESIVKTDTEENMVTEKNESEEELTGASQEILGAVTKKEEKIEKLTQKYKGDEGIATVAYYLERARYYSTPIFFIFLTIGAFNFFIVGNKKLDKKEQGFGWITACVIGWVFFQCVPLIFTLLVI